jgi:AraC-like DNA-binding protein
MTRPDRHNEIEINLLNTGSITYLLGGQKVRVEARRLSAFWAALSHQIIEFEDTKEYFVATLPLAWFLQCRLPESLVQSLLQGQLVTDSASYDAQGDLQLLAHWEKDLSRESNELHRAALLELEARLLRLAFSTTVSTSASGRAKQRHTTSQADLTKVERMASFIARNYTQSLPVQVISKHVGLHPNYAMALFKEKIGTTLVDYVTKQRISHAQRLLATTDAQILNVAFASGFASISRFNEAFRRENGCSPRAYRDQHRQPRSPGR